MSEPVRLGDLFPDILKELKQRQKPSRAFADYELYHYRTGSEIRAVYADRPEEVIAEFPSIHEAEVAWEQVMTAIS